MCKNLPIAAALATVVSTSAFAADMPLKAPPPPAPIVSWTGFYVGGNVGYGWGDPRTNVAGSATFFSFPGNFADVPAGFPSTIAFADSNTARLRGAIGGAQFGYNYQINPRWVLGLESDFQGSGQTGSNASIDQLSGAICTGATSIPAPSHCFQTNPFVGSAATGYEAKIGWFGTVRGRVGFLITDQVLVYGTGGLAYGRVEVSGTSTPSSSANFVFSTTPFATASSAFSAAKTNAGYTVGGGVEGKLLPWLPANWTWKLEYLYLDLGSLNSSAPFGGTLTAFVPAISPATGAVAIHTHFFDNIVRVGLNYKFGN
jgi:outer membrane immunogenic protein